MRLIRGSARKVAGGIAAGLVMATAAASLAPAAPVDQQTCDQMKREIVMLEGMGVRDNLSKGAAWGKANLRSQQLEQVKKLIEMDEAVAFRCPRPKPEPAVAAAKGKAVAKAAAAKAPAADGKTAAKDIVKPQVKPRPKVAAPADGTQPPAPATQSAAAPKPKPKPAPPKAPDAYTQPKAPAPN